MLLPEPSLEGLRSTHELGSRDAWSLAYPLLYGAGRQVAKARLAGNRHQQDREDLVGLALTQMVRGIVEKKTKSFNQISSWDDCLRMMRSLTRLRVTDFFREHYRNREDSVAEIPDLVPFAEVVSCGPGVEDIFVEIDRLDPPMPELFRDRFIEGCTIDEIAERRGLNRNTLCTWFANALRDLRERLNHSFADNL